MVSPIRPTLGWQQIKSFTQAVAEFLERTFPDRFTAKLLKVSRRGKIFYSCNRYPKCAFASWDQPIPQPCPQCNAPFIVEKTTKRAGTVRRCIKEGCGFTETVDTSQEYQSVHHSMTMMNKKAP